MARDLWGTIRFGVQFGLRCLHSHLLELFLEEAKLTARKNNFKFIVSALEPHLECKSFCVVADSDLSGRDLTRKVPDLQLISQFNPVIILIVLEQHGNNTVVNEISLVNTGYALSHNALDAEIHRIDRRVLAG